MTKAELEVELTKVLNEKTELVNKNKELSLSNEGLEENCENLRVEKDGLLNDLKVANELYDKSRDVNESLDQTMEEYEATIACLEVSQIDTCKVEELQQYISTLAIGECSHKIKTMINNL